MDEIKQLEEELKALRDANQATRAAEEQKTRAAELRAQVLAAKNALRDDPHLAELEGERGTDYDVVVCRLGAVALRKPSAAQWKKFQTAKDPREGAETMVRGCLLYPSKTEFNSILDDQPAALESFAMTCASLAGQDVQRLTGKS